MHTIYFGDNLDILRRHALDGTVNLIYIDPPFNTGKAQTRTRIKTVRSASGDRVGFQGQRYATAKMGSRTFPDRFDDYLAFLEPRGLFLGHSSGEWLKLVDQRAAALLVH